MAKKITLISGKCVPGGHKQQERAPLATQLASVERDFGGHSSLRGTRVVGGDCLLCGKRAQHEHEPHTMLDWRKG